MNAFLQLPPALSLGRLFHCFRTMTEEAEVALLFWYIKYCLLYLSIHMRLRVWTKSLIGICSILFLHTLKIHCLYSDLLD